MNNAILAEPSSLALVGVFFVFILAMMVLMLVVMAGIVLFTKFLSRQSQAVSPAPQQTITKYCPKCGAPLPPDSPEGLCPRCLIALNLVTQTEMAGETGPANPPPPPPPPVADIAKLFPQLEILECLGRGGMGAVYKARQTRLDRIVALKILSPEKQGNQKFAERFEREARALAKLHHPNIVTVFDFGEVQGNFYLLMEFVDGLTLRQLLQARQLSPAEALAIVPRICEALQYAHEQGIVHRDIKPENILMDKEGRVKIADFGIAKILGDGERGNLTEQQVIGTPHYMSPEQIEHPQAVDHRADIYSLGVVFYEMLTGELPLGKFQPPSKKVHIDVRLDEIVLRALEKEPERRYQQASEVKTQVEMVAATSDSSRSRGNEAQNESKRPTAPALPNSFTQVLMKFVTMGVAMLFACMFLLLAQNSHAIPADAWHYFTLGFEILVVLIFVVFFFVLIRAIKTNTPESWRSVRSWIPMLIVMGFGLAFGFYSPHLSSPRTAAAPAGVTLSEADFMQKFDSNCIVSALVTYATVPGGASTITGKFYGVDKDGTTNEVSFVVPNALLTPTMENKLARSNKIEINVSNPMTSDIGYQLLFLLFGGGFILLLLGTVALILWRALKSRSSGLTAPGEKPDRFWRWFAVIVLAIIAIPFLLSILGILAAIAIPSFAKAKQRALALRQQQISAKNSPYYISANTNHPQVVSVWPPDGASNVDPYQELRIRFSQPMDTNNLQIMWHPGGFLFCGQIRYNSELNEFIIPVQLLPGTTNKLQLGWAGQGFHDTNGNPADEFFWQFTTKPLMAKTGAATPRVVQVSPPPSQTMSVLTLLQVTFDQPMALDNGFPYLRHGASVFNLPGIISDIRLDSSGKTVTIPVVLPPDNETKLNLEGFQSADGAAGEPVSVPCEIGTNNYSGDQLNQISTAANDPRLKQLLESMKSARARYNSGIETVQDISLDGEKGAFTMLRANQSVFKWQGTNQFYEDISDIMNTRAFILGTDGKTCWLYYSGDHTDGPYLNRSPVAAMADFSASVADTFHLTRRTVRSAIARGKLIFEGESQLDGRTCYQVATWMVEQTGDDNWPVQASEYVWWIDAGTYLPVQLVQYALYGQEIYKFRYGELNQPMPDSAFQPPIAPGTSVPPEDWFAKKLGKDETRFMRIEDGCNGNMSGRMGRKGPNGTTDSGLN